ncbi:hypothetical protein [Ammoniphilus sp. YIM 78166]|uniref:hypothetical protein n=1 Tax=Ammoniphilus sp. YIM 78166 TaxID=1644106 RepID=UPI00106F267B|nr:hypothetical protein [Ammoniphilus sp. YIM 78166]
MNFGENIQNWFSVQIGAVFMVVLGALAIVYLIRREFSKFIGFFVFALMVSVFVFFPESIKTLGKSVFDKVFGA